MALYVWLLATARQCQAIHGTDGRLPVSKVNEAPVWRRATALERLREAGLVKTDGEALVIDGYRAFAGHEKIRGLYARLVTDFVDNESICPEIGSALSTLAWLYLLARKGETYGDLWLAGTMAQRRRWGTRQQVQHDIGVLERLGLLVCDGTHIEIVKYRETNVTPDYLNARRGYDRERYSIGRRAREVDTCRKTKFEVATKPAEIRTFPRHLDLDVDRDEEREENPLPPQATAEPSAGAEPPHPPGGTTGLSIGEIVNRWTADVAPDCQAEAGPETSDWHHDATHAATEPARPVKRRAGTRIAIGEYVPDRDQIAKELGRDPGDLDAHVTEWREAYEGGRRSPERFNESLAKWIRDAPERALVRGYQTSARVKLGVHVPLDKDDRETLVSLASTQCPGGDLLDMEYWAAQAVHAFVDGVRASGEKIEYWSHYRPRGLARWIAGCAPTKTEPKAAAKKAPVVHGPVHVPTDEDLAAIRAIGDDVPRGTSSQASSEVQAAAPVRLAKVRLAEDPEEARAQRERAVANFRGQFRKFGDKPEHAETFVALARSVAKVFAGYGAEAELPEDVARYAGAQQAA